MKIVSVAMLMIAAGLLTGCSGKPPKYTEATVTEVKAVKGSKKGLAGNAADVAAATSTTASGFFGAILFDALTKSPYTIVTKLVDDNGKEYFQTEDYLDSRFEVAKTFVGKRCLIVSYDNFRSFSDYCDEKSIKKRLEQIKVVTEEYQKKIEEQQAEAAQ